MCHYGLEACQYSEGSADAEPNGNKEKDNDGEQSHNDDKSRGAPWTAVLDPGTVVGVTESLGEGVETEGEAVKSVNKEGGKSTDNGSRKKVARIVDTDVSPGVASDERPKHEEPRKGTPTEEKGDKDGEGEGVRGMARGKSVLATPPSVDKMDDVGKGGIVGRTRPFEHGAEQGAARLIGDSDEEGKSEGCEESHAPVEVTEKNVENGNIEGYPHCFAGEKMHERVPIRGVAAVNGQKDGLVDMLQCF